MDQQAGDHTGSHTLDDSAEWRPYQVWASRVRTAAEIAYRPGAAAKADKPHNASQPPSRVSLVKETT